MRRQKENEYSHSCPRIVSKSRFSFFPREWFATSKKRGGFGGGTAIWVVLAPIVSAMSLSRAQKGVRRQLTSCIQYIRYDGTRGHKCCRRAKAKLGSTLFTAFSSCLLFDLLGQGIITDGDWGYHRRPSHLPHSLTYSPAVEKAEMKKKKTTLQTAYEHAIRELSK